MTTPATSQPQQEAEVHAQFEIGTERSVSDTPRTDAEDCVDWTPGVSLVPSDFARELERELASAIEERDQAQDDLRTARRALAAERTLAAQARELLSDSADKFVKGSDLLLQIPEGGV